jgi:chaperone required for assembly of F1-ATPase
MQDDLSKDLAPAAGEPIDPVEMARRDQRKSLPKRFYKEASIREENGAFVLTLDGKVARTPGRNPLSVPTRAAGEAMASEWAAQTDLIDPSTMPITRIVYSALDAVAREMAPVREEVVKYAGSDLLCYRAGEPTSLVAMQAEAWDPVLDWAREALEARFILSEGVMFVAQPEHAIDAVRKAVEAIDSPHSLAALHVMMTLTGSALLALAVARGRLTTEQAWSAAHVDEDFQIRAWGADAEAMARRERRRQEMEAAAKLIATAS